MITAFNSSNQSDYKDLFAKASEYLSGFKSVQTYKDGEPYWVKNANNGFDKIKIEGETEEERRVFFANTLLLKKIYKQVRNKAEGFVSELGITTLEEYYNWLPELKADAEGQPTVFTKLPLDEAHFEINANTRAIKIPDEFKKNGIAVQGDDLAEVVYFIVDRFYDAVDLNNTEIYIEWETPKGKNSTVTKSVSEPYLRIIDDEKYYGKLIFGWALSEAITKESGVLKFAVRFIQRDKEAKKIVYSLNTLTAQVTIHPNLGVDINQVIDYADNANDRLLDRIQYSEVVGGAKAAVPYFLKNLILLNDDGSVATGEDGYRDIAPGHKKTDDGSYDLTAFATADDTGAIMYVWKRAELDDNNVASTKFEEVDGRMDYVALTEDELKKHNYDLTKYENRFFYISYSDNDGYQKLIDSYQNLLDANTQAQFKLWFSPSEEEMSMINGKEYFIPTIYEHRTVLTVTNYGKYKVEARNRIFNSLTIQDSKPVIFRRPEKFEIPADVATGHIIGVQNDLLAPNYVEDPAQGDVEYQWYCDPNESKLLNSIMEFVAWPNDTKITYGEDYVRICPPNDQTAYKKQDVGVGGDPNTYYATVHFYYPEGAVKLREISWNTTKPEPDINEKPFDSIVDEHPGVDENGRKYIEDWRPLAYYTEETKLWTPYGWNKPTGEFAKLFNKIQWFDENDVLLREDYIEYQYASDVNFDAFSSYEAIPGANEPTLKVTEPGLYKLLVTLWRNKASTSALSSEYRVTNEPATPKLVKGTYSVLKAVGDYELKDPEGRRFDISWEAAPEVDEYEVTWYLAREEFTADETNDLDLMTYRTIETSSEFNPADELILAKLSEHNEDIEGYYYATVKTVLNDYVSAPTDRPNPLNAFSVTTVAS